MDMAFQLLVFSHTRINMLMFLLTGLVSYFIDYKAFRDKPDSAREATLVKSTAYTFVIGGAIVLILYQILMWIY
ncbi:CLC_0170 family protein [Alicyclobacillus fodiniaquatilis]|uniref:CLC_0170 family protein n=1 Tax=Alicyclobacillus fodiniaquatilis TaxID=1661150 RepID=A0ABW4JNI5_9BACL